MTYSKAKIQKIIIQVFIVLLFISFVSNISIVHADDTTITIDPSGLTNQNIGHYSNGFLLTSIPQNAPQNLINDLKPKLFRSQNPWLFEQGVYDSVKNNGGEIQYLVYETFFTANYGSDRWPGDNDDWTNWESSVRTAVQQVLDHNMKVEYEIWNEPDYNLFWHRDNARFFETWKRAYNIIKEMVPTASIAGPSLATYSIGYFSDFLNYAKANNVLPDTIVWHELDRNNKFKLIESRVAEFKTWAKNNGVTYNRIVINEILPDWDQYKVGTLVNYFSVLEKNQILGAHSCWEDPKSSNASTCWNRTLNGIVSANYKPRSSWWVYKYYAEMSGKLLNLKFNNSNISGFASAGTSIREVNLLIGADSGSSNSISINYKSPWNSSPSKLLINTYYLKDIEGNEVDPEVKSQTIQYNSSGTNIQVEGLNSYQAAYIKITEDGNSTDSSKNLECEANQFLKNNNCLPNICQSDSAGDGTLDEVDFQNFLIEYNKDTFNLNDLAKFATIYKVQNACV